MYELLTLNFQTARCGCAEGQSCTRFIKRLCARACRAQRVLYRENVTSQPVCAVRDTHAVSAAFHPLLPLLLTTIADHALHSQKASMSEGCSQRFHCSRHIPSAWASQCWELFCLSQTHAALSLHRSAVHSCKALVTCTTALSGAMMFCQSPGLHTPMRTKQSVDMQHCSNTQCCCSYKNGSKAANEPLSSLALLC